MKPKPVSKQVVCSVCGLDWNKHPKKKDKEPTLESCVEMLKAELARRPTQSWVLNSSTVTPANFNYAHGGVIGTPSRSYSGWSGIPLNPQTQVGKIEKEH